MQSEQRELQTKRLILRQWCDKDQEPFAQLNTDPRVMEYFPYLLSREESDQYIQVLLSNEEWLLDIN